jgi:hypothetical protein
MITNILNFYKLNIMSWKNTAQHLFADAMLVKHKYLNELDDVYRIINWQRKLKKRLLRKINEKLFNHAKVSKKN